MYTLNKMTEARNLVGTDINETEYVDHLVMENEKTYFQIISLKGDERLLEITDIVK